MVTDVGQPLTSRDPRAWLDQLEPKERALVAAAQKSVQITSLSGAEHEASRHVAAQLETLGYHSIRIDEVGNVVGELGSGPPVLMFNGHIDHVPPAGMEDPYGGQIVDGQGRGSDAPVLLGRGACDMKSNVLAGAHAAAFLRADVELTGRYIFTADVQEETDSPEGIQRLLDGGLTARYGLSGESSRLNVALGHRGKLQFDVHVHGLSSHASTPDDGRNAVYFAQYVVEAVQHLHEKLPDHNLYGRAAASVTKISSEPEGDVAVIPSRCTVRVDRRYIPGETPESCQAELQSIVDEIVERAEIDITVELVNVYPLMTLDADSPLVQIAAESVSQVTGEQPKIMTWRFGVNATFMAAAGIPSVGIGPGNEDHAHTNHEHIPLDELIQASKIYASMIERVCTGDQNEGDNT